MLNNTNKEFTDISSEEFRTYEFPEFVSVTIDRPMFLHVSGSGGHRVFDAEGVSHYIKPGWVHLYWKAKPNSPNFVK